MKYWSKSTLSVYRYLETMSNTIDKIVLDTGKNSNSCELQRYQTTYFQTSKIIELIERKRKMINLKVACERALNKLPLLAKKILTLFYIDGVKGDFVAQLLGISLRTFFRQKLKALKDFSEALEQIGFNIEYFEKEYGKEHWILSIYDECVAKSGAKEDCPDDYILKRMVHEVSKVNFACNIYI